MRKRAVKWLQGLGLGDSELARVQREVAWEQARLQRVRRDLRRGLRRDAFRLQQQGKLTPFVAERVFFDD